MIGTGAMIRAGLRRAGLGILLLPALDLLLGQGGLLSPSALVAVAAVGLTLVSCALPATVPAPAPPYGRIRTALRDRERRTAYMPQRDPDADGRPRPRAPGHGVPTAA